MIVRLKGTISQLGDAMTKIFQFYDSPIKSSADKSDDFIRKDFNSMIVRLKEQAAAFNVVEQKRFQFYDSPIKRSRHCRSSRF